MFWGGVVFSTVVIFPEFIILVVFIDGFSSVGWTTEFVTSGWVIGVFVVSGADEGVSSCFVTVEFCVPECSLQYEVGAVPFKKY